METELMMNDVETAKGTVTFSHVNGDWEFDGMVGFQAQLDGKTVMTVLVDVNDAEVGLFDFFAFKPGQDWNEMEHLGEEQDDAMAKLKKEIEQKEEITMRMNKKIKSLLENEIERHIVVIYDDQVEIDKKRVDVKNGAIRFWESKRVTDKLPLADLGCTEDEARAIIEHVALNAVLGMSEHPVTEDF